MFAYYAKKIGFLVGLTAVLSACMPAKNPTDAAREKHSANDNCSADDFAHLIGQSADALSIMRFLVPHRVILPNTAVTADYRANRVNFMINKAGLIEDIRCF